MFSPNPFPPTSTTRPRGARPESHLPREQASRAPSPDSLAPSSARALPTSGDWEQARCARGFRASAPSQCPAAPREREQRETMVRGVEARVEPGCQRRRKLARRAAERLFWGREEWFRVDLGPSREVRRGRAWPPRR